jgi:hypothetical protein
LAAQNFKVKNGITVGAHDIVDVSGNLTVPGNITVTGTISSASGGTYATQLEWSIISSNITAEKSFVYFVDTSAGAINITLPATASLGDIIKINDLAGTAGTDNITILRNGHKIQGAEADLVIDYNNATVELIYSNTTYGWKAMGL